MKNKLSDCIRVINVCLCSDKIGALEVCKAGGHDNIENEKIFHAGPNLAVHLYLLFNALLWLSFVPDDFRSGMIKPVKKQAW